MGNTYLVQRHETLAVLRNRFVRLMRLGIYWKSNTSCPLAKYMTSVFLTVQLAARPEESRLNKTDLKAFGQKWL